MMVSHKYMATWLMRHFFVAVAVIGTTMARLPESFILVGAVCILHHSAGVGLSSKQSRGSWLLMFHPAYYGTWF